MLTRPHPSRTADEGSRRPVNRYMQGWLNAPGSLTARLRLHGDVTVQLMRQGRLPLWPQEKRALRTSTGHIREVLLLLNGRPAVWARSCTPLGAVKGPWRAIKGLGNRPLAELLFIQPRVRRDALWSQALPSRGPARQHLRRQWHGASLSTTVEGITFSMPTWVRRSVFWHGGRPLQVMEAFAPWLENLQAYQQRHPAPLGQGTAMPPRLPYT